jgi:hypothetical protein
MVLSILLMPPSAGSSGAFIDNASRFADFAVAQDKSITFCREDKVKNAAPCMLSSVSSRLILDAASARLHDPGPFELLLGPCWDPHLTLTGHRGASTQCLLPEVRREPYRLLFDE